MLRMGLKLPTSCTGMTIEEHSVHLYKSGFGMSRTDLFNVNRIEYKYIYIKYI